MFTTLFKAFFNTILKQVEVINEVTGDQFFLEEAENAGWTFVGCFQDEDLAHQRADEALANALIVEPEEDFWNSNAMQKAMFEYECGGYED